ncbi:MAG: hypothetical protein R3F43_12630 [bacterium]
MCASDDACDAGSYCDFGAQCGDAGRCAPQPENCRAVDAPVCGCDGESYGNACLAALAGVSVASDGPCRVVDARCSAERPCADGQYCDYGAMCGDGGLTGRCVDQPAACRPADAPVCGCDHRSYENACRAALAV